MSEDTHEMDRVSFTADAIAARRTIMDIPYSQGIYDVLLEKVIGTDEEEHLRDALKPENLFITPFFEARYRLLEKLIRTTGVKKILEIAAGLAPRGLSWATDSTDIEYVEFDLPRKSYQKQDVLKTFSIYSEKKLPSNLRFECGDALNAKDLVRAVSLFKETGSIVIANEGLLRYLTHDQKRMLAENIRDLLERFGGYWITPDINLPDTMFQDQRYRSYGNRMHEKLGMNLAPNLFESIVSARVFFENLGFTVEEYSFKEVIPDLVSPIHLDMPTDEIEKIISWRVAFVMKLK